MEAYNEREKAKEQSRWIRDAWFTAQILMSWSGEKVNPLDLLPDWIWPREVMTKEDKERELKELKERLRIKD